MAAEVEYVNGGHYLPRLYTDGLDMCKMKRLPVHDVEGAVAATMQEDQYGPERRGRREGKEQLRRQHVGICSSPFL